MASYRPKSLDELNNMYDKTLAAEKAIKKGSSLLNKENFSVPAEETTNKTEPNKQTNSDELSFALNEFIANLAAEEKKPQNQPEIHKPVISHISEPSAKAKPEVKPEAKPEPAKVEAEKPEPRIVKPAPEIKTVSEVKPEIEVMAEIEAAPVLEAEPTPEADAQAVKTAPEIKAVSEIKPSVEAGAAIDAEPIPEVAAEPASEPEEKILEETKKPENREDPFANADRSVLIDEYMKIMTDEDDDISDEAPIQKKLSRKEKKKLKKKEKRAQEKEKTVPEETVKADEEILPEPISEESVSEPISEEPVSEPISEVPASEPAVYEAVENEIVTLPEEEPEQEKDDFDFPENYTPEWIEEDDIQEYEKFDVPEKKSNGKKVAAKVILSVLLTFIILLGALTTVFKSVLAVNTGKPFADNYYVFTAYKDFYYANILKGDLVITEKKYAENGDDFAYINYANKTFDFAKRTDGITNDDGEVLLIAENEGKRTLVSRDDCRGVVYATYFTVGTYIAFLTDNFIVVISVLSVLALIIILVLALGLKDKAKKKKRDQEIDDTQERAEGTEETEEIDEFEDIFSNIG